MCREARLGPVCLAESPHPYPDNYHGSWMLTNPDFGALSTRVHFSRLETESGLDWVVIRDGAGQEIQRISGKYPDGLWTNDVPGRVVHVQLLSDPSVALWGFCVDELQSGAAATRTPTATRWPTEFPTRTPTPTATPTRPGITPTATPTRPYTGPVEVAIRRASAHQQYPGVAFNSRHGEYLVVWEEREENPDIHAQRVSTNGALIGGMIFVSTAPLHQERPKVAYNSQRDEYLVVWGDGSGFVNKHGPNYIHGQRLSWDGQLIGGVIVVNRDEGWQVFPDIAYNSRDDEYLVVSQSNAEHVYGQRLTGDGRPIVGSFGIALNGRHQMEADVTYNSHANEYLVVWEDYRNNVHFDVWGRRVTAYGSPYSQEIAISTGPLHQLRPAVGFSPLTNGYLATWAEFKTWSPEALDPDLYAALISEYGLVGNQLTLSAAAWGQMDADIAFDPSAGEYIVAWTNNRPWDIRGQRLSPYDGSFRGPEFPICVDALKQHLPAIAANSVAGGFIVTWQDWRNEHLGYGPDIYAYVQP